MLGMIAMALYFSEQNTAADAVRIVRNNHQMRPAIVEPWGDDTLDGTHVILEILPCSRVQGFVDMQHNVIDVHDRLLSIPEKRSNNHPSIRGRPNK